MATSTPRSERPPDIVRAPMVSAVVADKRLLPKIAAPAGPYRRAWWRLKRDRLAMAALGLFGLLAAVSYLVPLAVPIDPYQQSLRDSLLAPGQAGHPLGTDNFGRDVLLRLIDGGRVSMTVGLVAVTISLVVGGLVGLVAGYFGRWPDRVLMRIIDVKLAFPGIMFVHLVPQVLGPAITIGTFGLATAILSTASLSFLGLGAQPPTAEWGLMLSEARRFVRIAWWLAVFPGLAIMLAVLAVNLLGDAVRDALDPRISSAAD